MRRILIGIAAAALAATCGLNMAQAQPQPAAPPAPGQADPAAALVKDRCAMCPDTDILAAGGRTPEAGGDLVASMVRKGAQLTDDEKAQVIAYLAKTYPAAAPAAN